jgi:thiol-disulfide isomerase/thioredoxin
VKNKYVFIDFWHSGCGPCMQMFDAVKDNFDEWDQKTNCKIIAVACQEKNEQLIKLIESKNGLLRYILTRIIICSGS